MVTAALGLGLAVISALLIARGVWGLRRLSIISSWPTADATVIAPGVDKLPPVEGGPTHRPRLAYQYTIDGKSYYSSRLGITPDAFDIFSSDSALAFTARYPPGSRVEIRVCPSNPAVSVVEEAASARKRNHFVTLVVSGILLFSVVAVVIYVA
jgi:hypothetical protein